MGNESETRRVVGDGGVAIGRFTYGHEHIRLWRWGEGASLTIGGFCSIGESVDVYLGGNHRTDWITTFPFGHIFESELGGAGIEGHPATNGDVVVGDDVWIGNGATIMSGVVVGPGAVIAASAHVVKDVAPYEIVGGNPARRIRHRFDEEVRALLLELRWWDLPVETIRTLARTLSSPPDAETLRELIRVHRR
jgi:acetyltransferase-like isoleucine patch superfamily enzyme